MTSPAAERQRRYRRRQRDRKRIYDIELDDEWICRAAEAGLITDDELKPREKTSEAIARILRGVLWCRR